MRNPTRFAPQVMMAIQRQLDQFGNESPGIQLAVLGSADGFPVASYRGVGSATIEPARIAAMTSSIAALGDAFTRETGLSGANNIIIESDSGTVVLIGVRTQKPPLALAIVAGKQAILGHLLWAARNTATAIARLTAGAEV